MKKKSWGLVVKKKNTLLSCFYKFNWLDMLFHYYNLIEPSRDPEKCKHKTQNLVKNKTEFEKKKKSISKSPKSIVFVKLLINCC